MVLYPIVKRDICRTNSPWWTDYINQHSLSLLLMLVLRRSPLISHFILIFAYSERLSVSLFISIFYSISCIIHFVDVFGLVPFLSQFCALQAGLVPRIVWDCSRYKVGEYRLPLSQLVSYLAGPSAESKCNRRVYL